MTVLPGCPGRGGVKPRAIILITLDTARADRLGVYGGATPTPHLDSLAREGTYFTRARTTVPLTLPSHATLLTGLHPAQHGVHNNGSHRLTVDIPILPELLKERGWATSAVVATFILDAQFGLARGFDSYDAPQTTDPQTSNIEGPERRAAAVTGAAIDWIRGHGETPFFLWVHYFDPHSPYSPPPPFDARFRDSPYDGEVAYMDQEIGRLIDFVRSSAVGKQVLFAVVGDHGESLGEHGEATHGVFLYEAVLRVPFILSGAGVPRQGASAEPVSTLDLLPTLLSAVGVKIPPHLPGRDLLARANGAHGSADRPILAETRMPCLNFGWSTLEAIVEGDMKLVRGAGVELYDLEADPAEANDLGPQRAADRQRLEAHLDDVTASLSPGVSSQPGQLGPSQLPDRETRARLESLGYIGGGVAPAGGCSGGADARRMLHVLDAINSGVRQFYAGRHDAAASTFRQVTQSDPGNVQAHYYLAQSLETQGQLEEAALEFAQASRLDPLNLTFRHDEAALWFDMGNLQRAEERLLEALEVIPGVPKTHAFLANVLYARGRFQEALAMYDVARAGMPPAADLEYQRARALLKLGRQPQGIEALRFACSLAPHQSEWHGQLGGLLVGAGKIEEAVQVLDQFVSRNPEDYLGLYNLGRLLEASGNPGGALQLYLRAEANWGGAERRLEAIRARIRQLGGEHGGS